MIFVVGCPEPCLQTFNRSSVSENRLVFYLLHGIQNPHTQRASVDTHRKRLSTNTEEDKFYLTFVTRREEI